VAQANFNPGIFEKWRLFLVASRQSSTKQQAAIMALRQARSEWFLRISPVNSPIFLVIFVQLKRDKNSLAIFLAETIFNFLSVKYSATITGFMNSLILPLSALIK